MKKINKLTNIKLIIFDLDGVLIDSKKNMQFAWNQVKKVHSINSSFKDYLKFIGLPFNNILKNLSIKNNHKSIFNTFKASSSSKFKLIKPYPYMKLILSILKKKNIKLGIVTSKDSYRTRKILKLYKVNNIDVVSPYTIKMKGKPYPDQLIHVLKKTNIKSINAAYVGDMYVDFLASKRAKMKFIFAKYGYGNNSNQYKHKISSLLDLKHLNYS